MQDTNVVILSSFLGLILGLTALIILFVFLLLGFIFNYNEIKEKIKEFFENRRVQKIAKKLHLVDKGVMLPHFKLETDSTGKSFKVKNQWAHSFCRNPIRIGLLEKRPVKWCQTCECIISEENDGGDDRGSRDDSPPSPIPPDVIVDTENLLSKFRLREPS